MPPVAAVVGAAAVSAGVGAAFGATIGTLTIAQTALVTFAVSASLGLAQMALTDTPKTGGEIPNLNSFAAGAAGRTQQIRQAVTPWRWVVGEARVSGVLTFIESTDNNKFIHMVTTLACHSCAGVKSYWLNDEPIYPDQLDADGDVVSGKYDGKVRLQADLGTTGQPFSDLVAEAAGWTADHKQSGHTKLYTRLEFDQDLFPTAVPSPSVRLRGRDDVGDPRDSGTRYTVNPALVTRKYMTVATIRGGLGAATSEIDDTAASAAANTCDEIVDTKQVSHTVADVTVGTGSPVSGGYFELSGSAGDLCEVQSGDRVEVSSTGTLPGGFTASTGYYAIVDHEKATADESLRIRLAASYDDAIAETAVAVTSAGSGAITVTKTGEPRYALGGVIETDRRPFDIINDLRSAMAGRVVPIGGGWVISAGAWPGASITLDEGDLAGGIGLTTKRPRRDRFNAVKGVYAGPLSNWVPTDYTPVTSSTYETADGGARVYRELDLPLTPRGATAQRIARIALERHRREIGVSYPVSLTGFRLQALDGVMVDNDRFGWTGKTFEIVEQVYVARDSEGGGPPALGFDLQLAESDANVYAWTTADETLPTPAPTTSLPNPFTVSNPTSFRLTTDSFINDTGETVSRILAQWKQPADFYARNGGRIEVQFKRSDATTSYVNSSYQWLASASGTNEYYLASTDSPAGDPTIKRPHSVLANDVTQTEGSLGSLAAAEWGWGDNDSLGFDTLYIRLADGADPDSKTAGWVAAVYWEPSFFVGGDEEQAFVAPVENDVEYDIRIRAWNHLGVRAATYQTLTAFRVGATSGGADSTRDYGSVTEPAVSIYDWGGVGEAVDKSLDYGAIT